MALAIRPMEEADTAPCATMAVDSEIGRRYGFSQDSMAGRLLTALKRGEDLFVAEEEGKIEGFAWMDRRGAFSSAPYLRLIAVAPTARGSGVGSALLEEFELRGTEIGRDYCLLVSDFNVRAQDFYARHGYVEQGRLRDFAVRGITEVLMVKPNRR